MINTEKPLIPFFVADRPASLQILKGIFLKYPATRVGIMTHAFTSKNLWRIFDKFPYDVPLLYEDMNLLKNQDLLSEHLIKMTDSGIFCKKGCTIEYEDLFTRYNEMGSDFGIMIDVFRDSKATIKSARRALSVYGKNKKKYRFKLVAVAQGNTLDEYLGCFQKLSRDFRFVAIGGLLKKREKSARYVTVRDEGFLYTILGLIRKEFNPDWLFALGCYHPSRHKRFEELGIWGSDYKGWIFNYQQKRKIVGEISDALSKIESENGAGRKLSKLEKKVQKIEWALSKEESEWRVTRENRFKKIRWDEINRLKIDLGLAYEKLLAKRKLIFQRDHLPKDYKSKLMTLNELMYKEEQLLRFQQVREYIETRVYGQLQ
jgi:hypothetical protein